MAVVTLGQVSNHLFDHCAECQVIESTGVVVTPYMEYPQLLGMLQLSMYTSAAASHVHHV